MTRVVVVCGPTASGKSNLSDGISGLLSGALSRWVKTLVVDSMQVYREIPVITNQARRRPAELLGVASVSDEWTVAHHQQAAREIVERDGGPCVIDAGTGMYLNATLLDIPLAPRVSPEIRAQAEREIVGRGNLRRKVREEELRIGGANERGSIWQGDLVYQTSIIYVRPPIGNLDPAIAQRSRSITENGQEEARRIAEVDHLNSSVRNSIGVREMVSLVSGEITREEAESKINMRTRRLARRQIRWFDKLLRSLSEGTEVSVVEDPERYLDSRGNDIIKAW